MALIRLNVIDANATNDYLRTLTGKDVGNPTPLDDVRRLGTVAIGEFTYVSTDLAAAFGFGFGSLDGSAHLRIMTCDLASSAVQIDKGDNGIDSWVYSAGYRIGILASQVESSAQLGLAALAATATLSIKTIQIQVLRFGIPDGPEIPIADFERFDVDAYGKFYKWQIDVGDYIKKNKSQLRPTRAFASLSIDMDQYFDSTSPFRYALRRIQDGQTLKIAINLSKKHQIPHVVGHESEMRAVYARVTGFNGYLNEVGPIDDQPIYDNAKKLASEWIQQFDRI